MDYNNNYQPNGNNQPVDPNYQQYNNAQGYEQTTYNQAPQGYEQPSYNQVPQGYEQPSYNQVPQGYEQPSYNQFPQGNQQYGAPQYGQPMYNQPAIPDNSKGFAIASLVTGILSVTCCCGGLLPSILAIVFGIISKNRKKDNNGMSLAGIILGAIGVFFGIIFVIWTATGGLEDFVNEMYYY